MMGYSALSIDNGLFGAYQDLSVWCGEEMSDIISYDLTCPENGI